MIPATGATDEQEDGGDAARYGNLSVEQGIIDLAEQGNAEAQERLGRLHKRGLGVEKNQVQRYENTQTKLFKIFTIHFVR